MLTQMTKSDPSRLAILLRHRERASRISPLITAWAQAGFAASAFSHTRHDELVRCFRSDIGKRTLLEGSLGSALSAFGGSSDVVAVIGWDMETDPGVLLSGMALSRSEGFLRETYSDGFVVCDQPLSTMLIVDFDENDVEVGKISFDRSNHDC